MEKQTAFVTVCKVKFRHDFEKMLYAHNGSEACGEAGWHTRSRRKLEGAESVMIEDTWVEKETDKAFTIGVDWYEVMPAEKPKPKDDF